MAWIRTIDPEAAAGALRRLYDEARARAGKVFQVVRLQSLDPAVLEASIELYRRLMLGPASPLTRAQREMIAVAVSRANDCHY
ncbi:MAG TPA: carboxymuconolactone decarboxylase family protein [Thermoanaerobaculia bacterium]|nr:carboxymuconolactone decarboxylase family protein [Thermoanaerobaculia bacterium]